MGCAARSSWLGILGTGLLGTCLLVVAASRDESNTRWAVLASWLATPLALVILPVTPGQSDLLDPYHSVMAWIIAAAVLLSLIRVRAGPARNWIKALGMTWLVCGELAWILGFYLQNNSFGFFVGLLLLFGTLIG